ncbi:MAG: GAF and ANTAR domain-containing protein [Jatrophihabitans sp.]
MDEPIERGAGDAEASDIENLRDSLDGLAGLLTEGLRLEDVLHRVAVFAVGAIPGADGAGVTLLRPDRNDNRVEALAASDPFVAEIDQIQYVDVNEGPCITAALERRTVRSGSLGAEPLWPRFGPRVGRLGVHSVLSLPLLLPAQVVGAINVYARAKSAFDDRAAELGETYARPAAVAVHNAHVLSRALTLTEQLQAALVSRPIIDQAIGLVRARSGATTEEAMDRLRAISHREQRKLSEVAQNLIDLAVRRANSREGR